MMKTIDQLIHDRRSIRKYKPDTVPDEWILDIIQCAVMAPSPSNNQPVRYFRITSNAVKDRLHQAMIKGYNDLISAISQHRKMKMLRNRINYYKRFSEFMFDAPVLFAVGTTSDVPAFSKMLLDEGILHKETRGHTDADITTGLALKGFLLRAESLGLGTCILTAPMVLLSDVSAILGIGDDIRITCFLTLGFPDETPLPIKRKQIFEVFQEI